MTIRNITFAEETAPVPRPAPAAAQIRLRTVTVSPHEEFQLRAGNVRPISNELHAAILSKKGRAEISLKGIVVEREDIGGRSVYWHPDSRICNDFSARERKIFYVLNPLQPDVIHLLDDAGAYLESLPRKIKPAVLDGAAQATELAAHRRVAARAASRLQELHGADTARALADIAANSVEMQRAVQTLPAPAAAGRAEPATAHGPAARVAAAAQDHAAGRTTYDRAPAKSPAAPTAETAAEILARRAGIQVECPY